MSSAKDYQMEHLEHKRRENYRNSFGSIKKNYIFKVIVLGDCA